MFRYILFCILVPYIILECICFQNFGTSTPVYDWCCPPE
jgi:hypothetical protein